VSLSGRDLIVDTESVGRYLSTGVGSEVPSGSTSGDDAEFDIDDEEWKFRPWKGTGIDILWFKDLDHAQVFDKSATRRKVISAIRAYCEET